MVATAKPTDRQYVAAAIILSTNAIQAGDIPQALILQGVAKGIAIAKGVDLVDVVERLIRVVKVPEDVAQRGQEDIEKLIEALEQQAEKIRL